MSFNNYQCTNHLMGFPCQRRRLTFQHSRGQFRKPSPFQSKTLTSSTHPHPTPTKLQLIEATRMRTSGTLIEHHIDDKQSPCLTNHLRPPYSSSNSYTNYEGQLGESAAITMVDSSSLQLNSPPMVPDSPIMECLVLSIGGSIVSSQNTHSSHSKSSIKTNRNSNLVLSIGGSIVSSQNTHSSHSKSSIKTTRISNKCNSEWTIAEEKLLIAIVEFSSIKENITNFVLQSKLRKIYICSFHPMVYKTTLVIRTCFKDLGHKTYSHN